MVLECEDKHFPPFSYQNFKGPRELCNQLWQYWQQGLEKVVLEHFLSLLPSEMQCWVRECGAETLCQAVALAEGFLISQGEAKEPGGEMCEPMKDDPDVSPKDEKKDLLEDSELPWLPTPCSLPFSEGISSQNLACEKITSTQLAQEPISFEDVAIYFSQQEWAFLSAAQRKMYCDIMLESYGNFSFLDPADDLSLSSREKEVPISPGDVEEKRESTECDQTFMLAVNFRERQVIPKIEQNYNSQMFGKSAMDSSDLSQQQTIHEEQNPYICPECGKSFQHHTNFVVCEKTHVAKHDCILSGKNLKIHTREKPYQCSTCGKRFSTSQNLSSHQWIHMGEKPYKCLQCGKSFTSRGNLKTHEKSHTQDRQLYDCPECGKRFTAPSSLIRHQKIHTGEKLYQCSGCEKRFVTFAHLTSHQWIHTGEKPHKCQKCGKSFTTCGNLRKHEKIHTQDRQLYDCPECGKRFTLPSSLVRHQRIHTGDRWYQCPRCEKRFITSQNLSSHQWVHTGEKPHKCQKCGKNFTCRGALKAHEKIHTQDRHLYDCPECGKRFTIPSSLVRHQRIHTGDKRYQCLRCEKRFITFTHLTNHQWVHTGEKPHKCMECGKRFTCQGSLKKHEKLHAWREKEVWTKALSALTGNPD